MDKTATIHIARHKPTGLRYRYETYTSWNTRYYNCDLSAESVKWHQSLSDARKAAQDNGTLETVE